MSDRFLMTSEANIIDSEHLGVINHKMTCGVPYEYVGTIAGLWAPPYAASGFRCEFRLDGDLVPVSSWRWLPFRFRAEGERDGVAAESDFLLASGCRGGLMKISLTNKTETARTVSVQLNIVNPTLDISGVWEFGRQMSSTPCGEERTDGVIRFTGENAGLAVAGADSFGQPVVLQPGETVSLRCAVAGGGLEEAPNLARDLASNWEEWARTSITDYDKEFAALYETLPRLESDNAALVKLYDRSLMHFFTNRWDVDEFVLNPYYGTGSILGGCVCCYLWNYGEPWEIMHLRDPAASREHMKRFLSIDLSKHFAFRPTSGKGFGPWYMINQEKIIGQVYFYTLLTGDVSFLNEEVDGRPIWEHLREQAYLLDDPSEPVTLIDYGDSNSHLELRRASNLYNHVMPDLNGRRYDNYTRCAALLELAGHPDPRLAERAETLKHVLKEKLWNRETRWFDFINDRGEPETRWTIQIYKLIASPVLDAEEEAGLLSHWNEEEFLGPYGVHSLAKGDPWYDPADIDNGGPGACTDFGPQIAERFYKAGYPELGADILRRLLWLGERMPYWGDSVTAGTADYRRDTPLQCMFDSVTIAQTVIFGMFGISARFDGTVEIAPARPDFAPHTALRGVRIRGLCFDVVLNEEQFTVIHGGREYRADYGETVTLSAETAD